MAESWQQLKIKLNKEQLPEMEAFLLENQALSITYQDAYDEPIYEPTPDSSQIWETLILTALFFAEANMQPIQYALEEKFGLLPNHYSLEEVKEENWVEKTQNQYQAQCFGENLWVYPAWNKSPLPEAAATVILNPGLAFGTGTHPTTAMCLRWLAKNAPKDKLIVDYGCGSGILALAALCLGAQQAWGVDYDPQALIASRNNAELNPKLQTYFETVLPEDLPALKADLILANILAKPLVALEKKFVELSKPGTQLVLSGILKEQAEMVHQAYAPHFELLKLEQEEDWVCLSFLKF